MTDPQAVDDLNAAAALLYSVGHLDPDRCEPGVQIHCLAAANQLHAAGAHPAHIGIDAGPGAVPEAIRTAMAHLGRLPRAIFANTAVLTAADAAHTALERADDASGSP